MEKKSKKGAKTKKSGRKGFGKVLSEVVPGDKRGSILSKKPKMGKERG